MVVSRWPIIGNIEYESPPPSHSLGPHEDDELEPEQKAAKRRRIEHLANDCLKGKEIYISSAVLKGTFDSTCVNPWRRKRREVDVPNSDHGRDLAEGEHGDVRKQFNDQGVELGHGRHGRNLARKERVVEPLTRVVVADNWENTRVERPSSRASVGYCAEWLQRQNTRSRTPTIDSDEETERPRRRGSITTTTKSPTQRALSRKLARHSSPARARLGISSRKERSSPNHAQSPAIEHHRTRVTTIDHDLSVVSHLPESMDVTAGGITLQHLPLSESQTLGNAGSPEDRTIATKRLERAAMPPPRLIGFTAINSHSKDGLTSLRDSARKEPEHQSAERDTRKSRHEVLRGAEKVTRRTASFGEKESLAASRSSKHPFIASPAVANGSPGFPYRRVSGGNRPAMLLPISSECITQAQDIIKKSMVKGQRVAGNRVMKSRAADTDTDSVLGNDDPIDDMEMDDASSEALQGMNAALVQPKPDLENADVEEVHILKPSAEDIRLNGIMARWRCPVPSCTREFNTRQGLTSHITRGHKLQVAKGGPSGRSNRKGASKSGKADARASKRRQEVEENVVVIDSIYHPSPGVIHASKAKPTSCPCPAPQLPESNFEVPDAGDGADVVPVPESDTVASPKGEAEVVLYNTDANDLAHEDSERTEPSDFVIEDAVDNSTSPLGQRREGNERKPAKESTSSKDKLSTVESGPTIPDRQDSRAYSTFTFNPEQSTQAALLQAQLAFQETQVDGHDSNADELNAGPPPRETVSLAAVSKSAYPLGAVTPFRELNDRFAAPAVPTPVFPIVPAATQDLEAAAAGVVFSTVKKPRTAKRISFENWPTTKPSKGFVAKAITKVVEWSPFASETPVPKNPHRTSPFALSGENESEIGRSERLPIEQKGEEITVLEAASSSFLMATPQAKSFLVPTPQARLDSFSARPASFSGRPITVSSAVSAVTRGSQGPSAPSDVPVPSFQEGQGLLAELNSQDVDGFLDEASFFLGSWDYEKGESSTAAAA